MTCQWLLYVLSLIPAILSQRYKVKKFRASYYDNIRGIYVDTTIYYPDINANDSDKFPVLCFGHGFAIESEKYSWFGELLVPNGYIVSLIDAFGIEDIDFELDQIFLLFEMKQQSLYNKSSPLYNMIDPRYAIASGHSVCLVLLCFYVWFKIIQIFINIVT